MKKPPGPGRLLHCPKSKRLGLTIPGAFLIWGIDTLIFDRKGPLWGLRDAWSLCQGEKHPGTLWAGGFIEKIYERLPDTRNFYSLYKMLL